jgi:magnesium transporter
MSTPQLVDLFAVLPHDHVVDLMALLPKPLAGRIQAILSEREVTALELQSPDYCALQREALAGDVLAELRRSGRDPHTLSYLYVVEGEEQLLVGVVDLRELLLAPDATPIGDIMTAPVIAAEADDLRDDLQEMFAKYHFRLLPVVDARDHMLGVVRYADIMKGVVTKARG